MSKTSFKELLVPYANKLETKIGKDDYNTLQLQIDELKQTKETFEKLLDQADKNAEEQNLKIKSLEERLQESETKKVKETADSMSKLEVRMDNLEHAVKPEFKAKIQRITETEDGENDKPFVKDPHKGGK